MVELNQGGSVITGIPHLGFTTTKNIIDNVPEFVKVAFINKIKRMKFEFFIVEWRVLNV